MPASRLGARPATRRFSLAALRSRIAAERERARFRLALNRMARDNPHLIDDIGLTNRQVEEEIAKLPFWQR
ncbi:DUF1127 domain-containing protein [Mesorhizobium sp. NFR06]|uniref:DUF1127 domain-containing protein n=1 Tax=Mesorhizobium sp. NFR06 TaxID=1566290 RepID=UPI00165FEBEB|nr:DUF1127 domain-containing protein [Mesorhizobium sp. NFR06]